MHYLVCTCFCEMEFSPPKAESSTSISKENLKYIVNITHFNLPACLLAGVHDVMGLMGRGWGGWVGSVDRKT